MGPRHRDFPTCFISHGKIKTWEGKIQHLRLRRSQMGESSCVTGSGQLSMCVSGPQSWSDHVGTFLHFFATLEIAMVDCIAPFASPAKCRGDCFVMCQMPCHASVLACQLTLIIVNTCLLLKKCDFTYAQPGAQQYEVWSFANMWETWQSEWFQIWWINL